MPTTAEPSAGPPTADEHADVVCLGCGCLCDDIIAEVADGRIVEARNACPIGVSWFLFSHGHRPAATIDGRPAESTAALDRAAEILGNSRRPIILGLAGVSIEAQGAAVALAAKLGAAIDPGIGRDREPLLRATQRVGRASATLGEVKNRADLVIFWGVDPVSTHPRHLERYSAEPEGRSLPNGRADRTMIVVDHERTPTADAADLFVPLPRDRQFEAIWSLRAIVRGIESAATGVEPALVDLADRLRKARYSAIFFGPNVGRSATVEALLMLVRDVNASARCVAMTLGAPGNASGAAAVLAWRTGFASGVDFSGGFPRSLPGEADAEAVLARREADAAMIVADDPRSRLSPAAVDHLGRIPVVAIGPDATDPTWKSAVSLASAQFGIDSGGSILRCDGIMLPVRPILVAKWPTAGDLIDAIHDRLRNSIGEVVDP